MRPGRFSTAALLLVLCARPAHAQEAGAPPGGDAPEVRGSLSNLTRVESWRFFPPENPDVEPSYTFAANRAELALSVRGPRVDLSGGFAYVRLENLPRRAIGPGGLGTGAFYFAASGLPYSYQVFLHDLTLTVHDRTRQRALTIGRMAYTSGAEGEAGDAAPTMLSSVRRLAIDGRLLGTFAWSLYQRRFDGVLAHWRNARHYAGSGLFLVTQGGYEESANLTMQRLLVGNVFAGVRHRGGQAGGEPIAETQLFGTWYRDRRRIGVRPDNAGVPVDAADVTIAAFGGSHVRVRETESGTADLAGWMAGQVGDWYGQSHRAYAAAAQAGFRWTRAAGRPWVRGGASVASGDSDGRDDRHGTFFPMLQETRSFAQSMVYAHANLRDLFVQTLLDPHPRVQVRVDLHRLDLAQAADRWYQGSGATARDGVFFGYSGRPSNGERGLGTALEAAAGVRISKYWSLNGYAGRMWGGPVVRGLFAGDRLFYWYVENVLALSLP